MILRYGKGHGSLEITGDLKRLIFKALQSSDDIMFDIIKEELDAIEANAKANWPVRQEQFGKSKNSRSRFKKGIRLIPPNEVEGFIRNTAPYAYAIKTGSGSSGNVEEGKRPAEELVFKPAEKAAQKIAQKIADDLMAKLR